MKQGYIFNDYPEKFPGKQVLSDVLLNVRVTPKAAKERIGDTIVDNDGNTLLKVYVTAQALENKANEAMIVLLSKHFNLPKTSLSIVKGHQSRNKTIKITNIDLKTLLV